MEKPETVYVVCGYVNGRYVSVPLRNCLNRREARAYGERKGWREISVIR